LSLSLYSSQVATLFYFQYPATSANTQKSSPIYSKRIQTKRQHNQNQSKTKPKPKKVGKENRSLKQKEELFFKTNLQEYIAKRIFKF